MLRLTSLLSRARITSSPALSQPGFSTLLARWATRASHAPSGPAQSSRARGANSTAKRHASVRAKSMLKRTISSSCRPPIRSSSPIQGETSAMSCSTRVMSEAMISLIRSKSRRRPGKGWAGRGLGRGDPEVQVDVGVDPHEQVLKDDRPGGGGRLEGEFPRLRRHAPGSVPTQRREVAVGEGDIKPLHPLAVVEEPGGDPLRNLGRDLPIDGHEVADSAALLQSPSDDGVEGLDYLVDRVDAAVRPGHHSSLPRRPPVVVGRPLGASIPPDPIEVCRRHLAVGAPCQPRRTYRAWRRHPSTSGPPHEPERSICVSSRKSASRRSALWLSPRPTSSSVPEGQTPPPIR